MSPSRSRSGRWLLGVVVVAIAALTSYGGLADRGRSPSTPPRVRAVPALGPSHERPRVVLVVGDSVMYDATPAIRAAVASAGVEFSEATVLGFGLSRLPYYDWTVEWPVLLDRQAPTDVVVMTGPWDAGPRLIDGRTAYPGSAEWRWAVVTEIRQAIAILSMRGAQVWWLSTPPFEGEEWTVPVAELNVAITEAVSTARRASVLGAFDVLADDTGSYRPFGRKDDGVHLCQPGAAAIARVVVTGLGLDAAPGWQRGAWRRDPRYRLGLEGGRCPAEDDSLSHPVSIR